MTAFLQSLIDGVMIGSAYALLALGFTLTFGVLRRLNLAYGTSLLVGAFAGAAVFAQWKTGGWVVAAATLAAAVAAGVYVERLCFWAMRKGAAIASMVSSFAVWMQLEELLALLFPGRTMSFPALVERSVFVLGPLQFRTEYVAMLVIAAVLVAALEWTMRATRFGLAVRAVTEHPEAARAMGVPVARIAFWAFVLASAIGGSAAYLMASAEEQVTLHSGMQLTFTGLIAMMIGGIGSLRGAVLGGVVLGVLETLAQGWLGTAAREFAAFGLLFLLLVLRPGGLLAQDFAAREAAALRRV
jgi:branched-subunit amino acid ABC-type transport system permease component